MGYYSRSNWMLSVPYRKSRAKPTPEPVLILSDAELVEMGRRLPQRDERARLASAPMIESKRRHEPHEGKAVMGGSIRIGNRDYSWAELAKPEVRRAIMPQVEAIIAAYKKNPEPWQAQGWTDLDVKTAIRWTGGSFDGLPEESMRAYRDEALTAYNTKIVELGGEPLPMATTLTQTTTQTPVIDGKTAFKELTTLMRSKEVVTALQRRRTGQSLDERQTADARPP